jgi:hypothetical protein
MVLPLLRGLTEERVVFLNPAQASRLPFALKGIIRLVDRKGNTLGLVLDRKAIEEIEEEVESTSPEFLASLEESRKSGRVPGSEVRRKIGLR